MNGCMRSFYGKKVWRDKFEGEVGDNRPFTYGIVKIVIVRAVTETLWKRSKKIMRKW